MHFSRSFITIGYSFCLLNLIAARKVELLLENFTLAEGPHWDETKQVLYFVDINGQSIHRYDPNTKQHTSAALDGRPTFIIPIEGKRNKFLITIDTKLVKITWDGVSPTVSRKEVLATLQKPFETFNDAKADPQGRLWIGTAGFDSANNVLLPGEGSLYIYRHNQLAPRIVKTDLSNGLAWNSALKKFYFADTEKGEVYSYDYYYRIGRIAKKEVIFTPSKHNLQGSPDGMSIDSDGNLWIALFMGSALVKVDPRIPETLLETIEFPDKQVTSIAFGGQNFEDLYVTTGKIPWKGEDAPPSVGGNLYKITNASARGLKAEKIRSF